MSRPRFPFYLLAASLALAAVVWAGTRPAEPWSPAAIDGRSDWYAVALRGEQVGYLRMSYRRQGERFLVESRMELRGRAQGAAFQQVQEERLQFAAEPPFPLREGSLSRRQDALAQELRFVSDGRGLRWFGEGAGRASVRPAADYRLDEALAPMRWTAAGAQGKLDTRFWDWEQRGARAEHYRALARTSGGVEVEQTQEGSSLVSRMRFAPDGSPLSLALGGSLRLTRVAAAEAMSFKASTDLYFGGGVPVDRALGEARRIRRLTLAVDAPSGFVLAEAPGQRFANGSLAVARPAAGEPLRAAEAEAALALEARHGAGDAELDALAARAVAGARTPGERIAKLVPFVAAFLHDEPVLQPVGAERIRRERRGDCTEHAQLFVALARRLGIPAREVSGLVYLGDGHRRFGGHAWAEVALEGRWQAVDPTWNELELDASHIRFGEGKAGEERLFLVQDGLRFRVEAVEHAD